MATQAMVTPIPTRHRVRIMGTEADTGSPSPSVVIQSLREDFQILLVVVEVWRHPQMAAPGSNQ